MKKLLFILTFLVFGRSFSQDIQKDNIYNQSSQVQDQDYTVEEANDSPADPPNPVPVDDYIPLLVIFGLGLIVYQSRKKLNLNS